ncbi:hypothetical protein NI821_27610, partial [Escherichia coli]|uniref:hypothetical protein n=1 Tax=Escherichia coli TaxID=562 RepID=UPI00209B008C
HTNRPLTDFGGKTSIFSHPVYLFLREFSLQDFRGGSIRGQLSDNMVYTEKHIRIISVTTAAAIHPVIGSSENDVQ